MAVTRVATLASHNALVSRLLDVQTNVHKAQVQVSTEKKSLDYAGIALDAERLVNFENQSSLSSRYIQGNTTAELRLNTMSTSIDAVETVIRNFRSELIDFSSLDLSTVSPEEQVKIEDISARAFEAMKDLESYLNVRIEGRYLFSGGKTDTLPVNVGYTTLASLQAAYDGTTIKYPASRAAQVNPALTSTEYGTLTFTNATSTITAATAGAFVNLPVGSSITVAGSTSNNSTFTIASNDGTNIVVNESLTNEAATAAPTLTGRSFYNGDQLQLEHRVDDDRTVTLGINASQGAFEKALRAMGTIAQDGLESNTNRIDAAIEMLNDALLNSPSTTLNNTHFGTLSFTTGANTITSPTPGAFANLAAGASITITGTTSNDGTYTILSNDGTTITTAAGTPVGVTEAGLTTTKIAGVSTETGNDITTLQRLLGRNMSIIAEATTIHQDYIGFLDKRAIDMENVNILDAVTRLNDQTTALDISMKTLARINNLSLANYI